MENYGNTGVKVLGKFHAFLRWKDQVFKQLFYITDADKSPNLLSRDACYTHWCIETMLHCGKRSLDLAAVPQALLTLK